MPKTWIGLSCCSEAGRVPLTDPLQGRYRPLTGVFGTELVFASEEIPCL